MDALGDVAEVGLDTVVTSGSLEEIPGIKLITGFYQATVSIRDDLNARKLHSFLQAAAKSSGASPREREEALQRFGGERKRQMLGETMILLLDRADDMRKPLMHGRIMGELMAGNLNVRTATILCTILDKLVFDDLETLLKADPSISISDESDDFSALHRLQANGLMYQSVYSAGNMDTDIATQQFSLNSVGKQMVKIYREMLTDEDY